MEEMEEYTKHITQWMLHYLRYYVFRSIGKKKASVYMYILKLCLQIHKDQGLVYIFFKNFKKNVEWIIQDVKNLETLRGCYPPWPTFS